MAVTKQQVIFEFDAETGELTGKLNDTKKSVERVTDSTTALTNQLDKMTGGAVSGFKNAVSGTKSFIKGLKLTKAAIIGTGIGALVIAVVGLVKAFTRSEEGARKFARSFEVIKTVTNVIIDRLGMLGKAVVQVFEGDFSGAANTAREAVSGINKEIKEEVALFDDLIQREHALQDARIAQRVETAKTRAEIKELNLIAEDTTKSLEEREAAAAKAGEMERQLFERRKELAEEELAIAKARLENTASTTEDRERVAELEANIFDLARESLELQTTLNNKLNIIRAEGLRLREQELEVLKETAELLRVQRAEVKEIEQDTEQTLLKSEQRQTQIMETESQKRRRLRREDFEVFRDFVLRDQETMIQAAGSALNTLSQLNAAFSQGEEEQSRKGFERAKRIQAAQTLISTFESATGAYKSVVGTPFVGPVLAPIAAAAAAALGLKNVDNIMKQQYNAPSGTPATSTPALPNISSGAVGAPQLDLGFLGEGSGQNTIRAYVVAGNVSNAQQANQKVEDQTTL